MQENFGLFFRTLGKRSLSLHQVLETGPNPWGPTLGQHLMNAAQRGTTQNSSEENAGTSEVASWSCIACKGDTDIPYPLDQRGAPSPPCSGWAPLKHCKTSGFGHSTASMKVVLHA